MIRALRLTRRSAVVSRSQVTNQLHALTVTAPPQLREQLEGRTTRAQVAIAVKFRPGDEPDTVLAATRYAMKKLALRFRALDAEIKDLDRQLTRLVTATAPRSSRCAGSGSTPRRRCWSPLATTPSGCAPKAHSPGSPAPPRSPPHPERPTGSVSPAAGTARPTPPCT